MVRSNNKRGFTILEVLIATLLVGLGLFALIEALDRSYLGAGSTEDYSLALSLTQEKLEEIRDTAYLSINNEAKSAVSGFPDFQREVAVSTPLTNLKQVIVTTYWNVPNSEKSINLSTYVINN